MRKVSRAQEIYDYTNYREATITDRDGSEESYERSRRESIADEEEKNRRRSDNIIGFDYDRDCDVRGCDGKHPKGKHPQEPNIVEGALGCTSCGRAKGKSKGKCSGTDSEECKSIVRDRRRGVSAEGAHGESEGGRPTASKKNGTATFNSRFSYDNLSGRNN